MPAAKTSIAPTPSHELFRYSRRSPRRRSCAVAASLTSSPATARGSAAARTVGSGRTASAARAVGAVATGDHAELLHMSQWPGPSTRSTRIRRRVGSASAVPAPSFRPDIVGVQRVWTGAESYIEVAYFTSEAAAREGEKKEPPPELAAEMGEFED